MTKFHMRRDYAKAGELLLAAAPHLTGDKAASAAFHGARALSRVDRDDEAIAGYQQGGRRIPALALRRRGAVPVRLARLQPRPLQGEPARPAGDARSLRQQRLRRRRRLVPGVRALPARRRRPRRSPGFERYARMPATGITDDERGDARRLLARAAREKLGRQGPRREARLPRARPPRAAVVLRAARRAAAPQARRASDGAASRCPAKKIGAAPPRAKPRRAIRDRRARARAARRRHGRRGGRRAERDEKEILQRAGGEKALPWLLGLYRRAEDFHRAYQLRRVARRRRAGGRPPRRRAARASSGRRPSRAPTRRSSTSTARPPATPTLYLYAIMRKESGFDPHDVSYADARGLLQMIPPTSARVAATAGDAVLPRPALRPRGEHPPRRALHRRALREVRRRGAARRRRLQRGAARDGALVRRSTASTPPTSSSSSSPSRRRASTSSASPASTRKYRYLYGPTPYEIPLTLDTKVGAEGPDSKPDAPRGQRRRKNVSTISSTISTTTAASEQHQPPVARHVEHQLQRLLHAAQLQLQRLVAVDEIELGAQLVVDPVHPRVVPGLVGLVEQVQDREHLVARRRSRRR